MRKRNLKATVEKGKKPHHFLDFLFLADNRDMGTVFTAPARKAQGRKSVAKKGSAIGKPARPQQALASKKSHDSEQSVSTAMSTMTVRASNAQSASDFHLKPFYAGVFETPRGVGEESRANFRPLDFDLFTGPIPPFHSGLMMPKVTPPRYYPNPPINPDCGVGVGSIGSHCNINLNVNLELPSYQQWLPFGGHHIDDNALLHSVTMNGLVTTPTRRDSEDDIVIDLDDTQLMVQLSDVFKEREDDDTMDIETNKFDDNASLSADDIDVLMSSNEKDDLMSSNDMELFGELADGFSIEI